NQTLWTFAALAVSIFLCACNTRKNAVSGTIEVDEAHVGPRAGGRVEKILAWEGDRLHEGQVLVQLDASELRARRDLATAQIDTELAEMQVTAPADSILEVLSVKVGDVLPANREAATLLLTGHLWVRVYVPESWLGLIKLGEHVRVRVDSFPHTDFDGVVEQINRQAEFTPRNVQTVADRIKQVFGVKVRLPSDNDRLRAGMAADVYFPNVK